MTNKIYNEDCLGVNGLCKVQDKSIGLILCDLPYEVTKNKWDIKLPLDKLWNEYKRVIKDNGAIILFGQGLFTAELMNSNPSWWRYNLIWDKVLPTGFLNSNRMPLRSHEDIIVFYKKLPTYNPQMVPGEKNHSKGKGKKDFQNNNYGKFDFVDNSESSEMKYPKSILSFPKPHPSVTLHSTQKSLELCEYLIKTYSNEGDTVLDNCIGSGQTIIASINTNRNYIGFEKEKKYFDIVQSRIDEIEKLKQVS